MREGIARFMKSNSATIELAPVEQADSRTQQDSKSKQQPRFHVVLWDDDDHSYDYVIRMMKELFGHPMERGMQIASEVDTAGRAICLTTTKEHAELKRDQIHAYGRDLLIDRCKGAMWATIEAETPT